MSPPDFKCYSSKLANKNFPIWLNVNFELIFSALNNTKKREGVAGYIERQKKLPLHNVVKFLIS